MAKRLEGKVAIVTGASSGIGQAIAAALATEGATVVRVSRSMTGEGAMQADVTDRAGVHAMVAAVVAQHGKVDILVNAAGVMYFTLLKNAKYEQWEKTVQTNCVGTMNACGAVLPGMLAAKAGHIVNISSDAAKQLFGALTVYNASKAFVSTFSKGLRAECVGTGLRVTDVQPGDTATALIMGNDDAEAAEKMGVTVGATVGGGEVGPFCLAPSDVADAVVYALTAPPHVGVHEILIEPRDQMFGDPTAMNC